MKHPISVEIDFPNNEDQDGGVYIMCHDKEIVSWTSDEFKEGMEAVFACIHAIDYGKNEGGDALAESIGKMWAGDEWVVKKSFFVSSDRLPQYWVHSRDEFHTVDIALHLNDDDRGYFLIYSGENNTLLAQKDFDILDEEVLKDIAEWFWRWEKDNEHPFSSEKDVLDALTLMFSPIQI